MLFTFKEVQRLQEFLNETGGKFGGWHEHNHNLFLQSRLKYINTQDTKPGDEDINYQSLLQLIIDDILQKNIGRYFKYFV